MTNPRISPSGPPFELPVIPSLLPYLLKADVQLGRFIISAFSPGAGVRGFVSKAYGPDDWTIANDNTIILPAGKYAAIWGGRIAKLDTVSVNVALASTSGGVNMSAFQFPTTAYSDYVTMPAMWEALADGEELYVQSTSSGAAPTVANSNIYLLKVGPLNA